MNLPTFRMSVNSDPHFYDGVFFFTKNMKELSRPKQMVERVKRGVRSGAVDIKVKGMRYMHLGWSVPDRQEIQINKDLSDTEKVITLFHEYIHLAYPNLEENAVEEFAQLMFASLSLRQIDYFVSLISLFV